MEDYIFPQLDKDGFHCPHCGVYAQQYWETLYRGRQSPVMEWKVSKCRHCKEIAIWKESNMIFPRISVAPQPNEDMPDNVMRDFIEARYVVGDSPRAAASLLRLAIQRLMKHLDARGGSLHKQIGNLVEDKRVSPRIQQALDSVRVVGNESVHPGKMDMDDDRETALVLFKLVNAIVEETITRDKMVSEVYNSLPENKREGIEQRDSS